MYCYLEGYLWALIFIGGWDLYEFIYVGLISMFVSTRVCYC